MKPLIVAGIPRTGTTITAKVINTHPEINMTVEKRVIWVAVLFLKKLQLRYPLENYPFAIKVSNKTEFEYVKEELMSGLRYAIEDIYDPEKYEYFGDKYPFYLYEMETINRLFTDVKYILTYKNDLEYCTKSMLSRWWAAGMTAKEYKSMFERGMAIIERNRNNQNVYILDQDKFRAEPKAEMQKVADFLGVENKFDVSKVNGR